jgi:hypothetical protein
LRGAAADRLRSDPEPAEKLPGAGSRRVERDALCGLATVLPAGREEPGREEDAENDDCMKILFRITEYY